MYQCTCAIKCFIYLYRYGFQQLIDGKCADILQPDITWMGGITEVRRREDGREGRDGGREKGRKKMRLGQRERERADQMKRECERM